MPDTVVPVAPSRAALSFVMVTVFLDMLAMSIVIPVLPRLVLAFNGGDTAAAAAAMGVFGVGWNLMQFLAAPVVGALSDRFGRRPIFLLSNFGLGADYVLMALAPGLALLFVGRLISGVAAATFSTASAYVADITPPEQRAARFGLISMAFGVGFVIGPAIGGLLGGFDPRLPFWVAGGLSLLNFLYGVFVLPESLPRARRAAFGWRGVNPLGGLALLRRQRQLLGLAAASFLFFLAQQSLQAVFVLAATYRYGWGAGRIGLALAGFGLCAAVTGGLLVRPVTRRLGERRTMLAGLGCAALGFAGFALADAPWLAWAALPVLALMGLMGPASQAIMTRLVPSDEQGRLQGAMSSIMSCAGLVGPPLFTGVLAAAVGAGGWGLPGAPYWVASAIMLAALALTLRVTRAR